MSDNNFEVAFSGQLVAGADPAQVKAKVAVLFKTDVAKIEHMFSGARVVIKKGLDQATAVKYQAAMKSAGAVCEVRDASAAEAPASTPAPQPTAKAAAAPVAKRPANTNAPAAPQTVPLHVSAADIAELKVDIAPVGSDMNQQKKNVTTAIPDISGLTMAPPGSELSTQKKVAPPPPPDTGGLSIVKN
jgi:hypothetical protein